MDAVRHYARFVIFPRAFITHFIPSLYLPTLGMTTLPVMLPIILIVAALVGLLALSLWHSKLAGPPPPAPVAASNHKSVRFFDYAPKPILPAAPATTVDILEQLMTGEDSHPEKQVQAVVAAPEVKPKEVVVPAPMVAPGEQATVVAKETVAPATTVSALDMLGDNELSVPKSVAPDASSNEAGPDPSLFYNPFTRVAPTAIDKANQVIAHELRKRKRAAFQSRITGQKEALSTLYKQD